MTTEMSASIVELLAATAAELRAEFPAIEKTSQIEGNFSLLVALRKKDVFAKAVSADKSFGNLRRGWVSYAGGGHAYDAHALPIMLVSRVLAGEDAASVVASVREFATKGTSDGYWYGALSGVKIGQPFSLSEGLDLIPWESVPDCQQRQRVECANATVGLRPSPNGAIRARLSERQVLFATAMDDYSRTGPAQNEFAAVHSRAIDVVRAITVATGRPASILASWARPNERVIRDALGASLWYSPSLNDPALFGFSLDPVTVDPHTVASVFSKLAGFKVADRAALSTAIDRISAALRWKSLGDKAIDLGIALEVLLLHDLSDHGELTYRISIRGAQFLGGNNAARLEHFQLLKKTYALRSKAVHKGAIESSQKSEEVITAAISTSLGIAKKLIEMGRFPEWESEFVIAERADSVLEVATEVLTGSSIDERE